MVSRSKILMPEIRRWVNTPFQHQGRFVNRGCDCAGLLLCVAEDLALRDRHGDLFNRRQYVNYPPQMLSEMVHEICKMRLTQKPVEQMRGGDVITLKFPDLDAPRAVACHAAWVTEITNERRGMVHAYEAVEKVVEHGIDPKWEKRIAGVFEFSDLED